MPKKIPDIARKAIVDKLILIGEVPGNGSYHSFFQRVYPKSANIPCNKSTLLLEIARHCDAFPDDWGDEAGIFNAVDILHWEDQDFLYFCQEYVNPVFNRSIWNEETGEWHSLQPKCVDAINFYLRDCGYELRPSAQIGAKVEYELIDLTGVKSKINNIVFAATMKPDIVLTDVLNNDVFIPIDEDKYLLYDQEISARGLTWGTLLEWYSQNHLPTDKSLVDRLLEAVKNCGSPIEEQFFSYYLELVQELGNEIPALLPQVYLYYDPKGQRERTLKIFDHQCMDFLMLFSSSNRVVIELDGIQHYSDGTVPNPGGQYPYHIASTSKYASMVSAQREMTLAGYEVYRFGGIEFQNPEQARRKMKQFFVDLLNRHGVIE